MGSSPSPIAKSPLLPARVAAVFLVFLAFHPAAQACSCSRIPTSCQSIGPDSAILLGEVTSIESGSFFGFLKVAKFFSGPSLLEQYRWYSDRVTVVFNVEETFSGTPQKTARLHIGKYIGACGYEYRPGELFFKKSERYLVYAYLKDGVLSTDHCSKTRLAHGTDPEIENLRRLSSLSLPIVTGNYFTPSRIGPNAPLSGQTITLTSSNGQSFSKKTDADGRFTFSSLTPGTYQVRLTTPKDFAVNWSVLGRPAFIFTDKGIIAANSREADVSPGSCTELTYSAFPDGRISGYVTDPRGYAPESASLGIWHPSQVESNENKWWIQYPDLPGGKFEFGPLLPGTYVIGTYIFPPDFAERSKDMNYLEHFVPQVWFYPGTTDKTKAEAITIGFGRHVSNLHFIVPTEPVPDSSPKHK